MSSEPAPQQLQVYRALSIAAEKIANNLYRLRHKSPYHYSLRHMGATRGGGYSKSFVITDYSHRRLVEAMPKVLSGAIGRALFAAEVAALALEKDAQSRGS